tara:strand:- start:149 stop:445 length:297 start_codon:yes stop_codon:yes gene_type:complete
MKVSKEQLKQIIKEELEALQEQDKNMVVALPDRLQILIGDQRVDLKFAQIGKIGEMLQKHFTEKPDGYILDKKDEAMINAVKLPDSFQNLVGLKLSRP